MMKKRIAVYLLAVTMLLGGCGGAAGSTASQEPAPESSAAESVSSEAANTPDAQEEESSEEVPVSQDPYEDTDTTPIVEKTVAEEGIEAFVTVGDYKGLELTKTVETVSDEYVDEYIQSNLEFSPLDLPDDAKIENGMVANINYVGRIDGVAFDGGTGQDYDLKIGSGSFIDGFEDQLVGAKKGDEVIVKVTFPQDYFSEELAGKDAEFTVTVNQVKEIPTEATDEWIQAVSDYNNLEEYREFLREDMQKKEDAHYLAEMRAEAWSLVRDKAEFTQYPKELYDKYEAMVWSELEGMADMYGMNLQELMTNFGVTKGYVTSEAKNYTQVELIAEYILMKEGKSFDDPEVEEIRQRLIENNGYANKEDALANGVSEDLIEFSVRNAYAMDNVIGYAVITEVEASEEELSEVEETEQP